MMPKTQIRTVSDPSDYSPEEAERIAKDELKAYSSSREIKESTEERYSRIRQVYGLSKTWSLGELLASDIEDRYIVAGCLADNQPCVIAGASKTLKTTVAIGLVLAIASGKDFLGRFKVESRRRVLLSSAESGIATIKKTAIGLAKAMDIDLDELVSEGWIYFNWWAPKVSSSEMMDLFCHDLEVSKAEISVLDPLYQSLDDQQASYILNGQQLADLSKRVQAAGAMPIMLDHVKRSSVNAKEFAPLELEDVSGSGKAEFFRQWILLSRRKKIEASEPGEPLSHCLWMSVGGSAGHSSQWSIDITESNPAPKVREFEIQIEPRHKAVQEANANRKSKADEKSDREEDRFQRKAKELIEKVYANDFILSLTKNDIEDRMGLKNREAGRVIAICVENGWLKLQPKSAIKNGKGYDGYQLPGSIFTTGDNRGQPGTDRGPVPSGSH